MPGPECINDVTCQEAALWYHQNGLRPIPWTIRDGTKVASVTGFTYQDYTKAPSGVIEGIIRKWEPDWQVGLALSEPGNFFAIDVDSFEELHEFEEAHGILPRDTWIGTSGREDGGEHYLVRRSKLLNEWPRHGKFSQAWQHLEVIANGLLAAPPSMHPSGRKYRWSSGDVQPAECPSQLAFWLNERQTRRGVGGTETTVSGAHNPPGRLELTGGVLPQGSRNSALVSLAGSYRYMGHEEAAILSRLRIDNDDYCQPPVPDHEVVAIANWVARKPASDYTPLGDDRLAAFAWVETLEEEKKTQESRIPVTAEQWRNILRIVAGGKAVKRDAAEILPRSDLKVAEFMEKYYYGNLTYGERDKQWRLWNGKAHIAREESAAASLVMSYAEGYRLALESIKERFISDQVAQTGDRAEAYESYKKVWGKHRAYRDGIMNDPVQTRVLRQLKKRERISVNGDYFFQNRDAPYLLNFENGTFDVRTGALRPHNRDDRLTSIIRRTLDISLAQKPLQEVAPKFWQLIWRMCGAAGEVSDTRQKARAASAWRWSGYQCHGSNPEKKMAIFEGASNIGKNQLEEIIAELLGPELAHTSSSARLLIKTRNDRHDSISNVLMGRRMVVVNELSENQFLDEQQVLVLVNPEGTMVDLRHLHHDSIATAVTWKITVTTNQLAKADLTPQVINRLLILPLSNVQIPKEEQFDIKREILEQEADAVLAHLVAEWHEWYKTWKSKSTGLLIPPDAVERLSQYQDDNEHPAAQFIAERCRLDDKAFITHTSIWRMCEAYYKDQHSDHPTRYTGGRRKLFSILDETPGVVRIFQPNRRLKGFQGIDVLPPENGSKEQQMIWDSWTGT